MILFIAFSNLQTASIGTIIHLVIHCYLFGGDMANWISWQQVQKTQQTDLVTAKMKEDWIFTCGCNCYNAILCILLGFAAQSSLLAIEIKLKSPGDGLKTRGDRCVSFGVLVIYCAMGFYVKSSIKRKYYLFS